MTDMEKTAEEKAIDQAKLDELMKLTAEEEAELKAAAARGSYVKEFELQGRTYAIGTTSNAANERWNDDKVEARVQARKRLSARLGDDAGFLTKDDVDAAAITAINTAYVTNHLRTVDGEAVNYEAALAVAKGVESVIQGAIISEIEAMYQHYKDLLMKLQYGSNAKKSQALASSSTNS